MRFYLNCKQVLGIAGGGQSPNEFEIPLPAPIDLSGHNQTQFFVRIDEAMVISDQSHIKGYPLVICCNIAVQQVSGTNYDHVLCIIKEGSLLQNTPLIPAFPGRFYETSISLKTTELIPIPDDWVTSVSINLSVIQQ